MLRHSERRVAAALVFDAERHVGRTLQLDVDGVAAEDLVEHLTADVDRRYQAVAVVVAHRRFAAFLPVVLHGLLLDVVGKLILCHDVRLAVGEVADFADEDVLSGERVVLDGTGDVIRILELDARLVAHPERVVASLSLSGEAEADKRYC